MPKVSASYPVRILRRGALLLFCAGLLPTLIPGQGVQRSSGMPERTAAGKCAACHTTESLTAATSKYFEHYKTVHREAQRRNLNCATCHAPIAAQVRAAGRVPRSACAACHKAEPAPAGLQAAAAHSVHLARSDVSCASCHRAANHRIEMLQLLDTCSNCH